MVLGSACCRITFASEFLRDATCLAAVTWMGLGFS